MEHLVLPQTSSRSVIRQIPYVSETNYDGGPFLDYDFRLGFPKIEIVGRLPGVVTDPSRNLLHSMSNEDLQSLYQRWLFFGLIREVLGDKYDLDVFVIENGIGERFLSTSKLVQYLDDWIECTRQMKGCSEETYRRIARCFGLCQALLAAAPQEFDTNIKLQLATVAELLCYATSKVFDIAWTDNAGDNLIPGSWHRLVNKTFWKDHLQERGWCPSQVKTVSDKFLTLQSLHFIINCRHLEEGYQHDQCNENQCLATQVKISDSQYRHFSQGCKCDLLHIEQHTLDMYLRAGQLPLIRIRTSNHLSQLSADIVPWQEGKVCYIALSHVWADGLGNPKACALPRCQMAYLKTLMDEFRGQAERFDVQNGTEILLWCDTLCCPVEPEEAKNLALNQMYRVYDQANFVLVLDKSLTPCAIDEMESYEACARIALSRWMRRLWTLQEGALPARRRKLWFQFGDRAENIETLHSRLRDDFYTSITRRGLGRDMLSSLSSFHNLFIKDPNLPGADLGTVTSALEKRSVSVPSDEPLLLATLLGLDLKSITGADKSSRMIQLWRLMPCALRGIPKDIVFRNGPRLTEPGLRWAPATFLLDNQNTPMDVTGREEDKGHLVEGAPGLKVRLPGFRVNIANRTEGLPPNTSFTNDVSTIYMRDGDGSWYILKTTHLIKSEGPPTDNFILSILSTSSRQWILHPRPTFPSTSEKIGAWTGILVEETSSDESIVAVRTISHIQFGLLSKYSQEILKVAYMLAKQLEMSKQYVQLGGQASNIQSSDSLTTELQELATSEMALQVLTESGRDGSEMYIVMIRNFIHMIFRGVYVEIKEHIPDSQEWYVD